MKEGNTQSKKAIIPLERKNTIQEKEIKKRNYSNTGRKNDIRNGVTL